MQENQVWFMQIEIPFELMDDIKEGSIDLADQTIDLSEIDNAYDSDLEQIDAGDGETDEMNMADDEMSPDEMAGTM